MIADFIFDFVIILIGHFLLHEYTHLQVRDKTWE